MGSLLGIDIGTTGCKVVAVDDQGIRHRAYEEYPLSIPEFGAAELDTEYVWQALQGAIRQVTGECNEPPEALCVSVLGEAVTAVGKDRKPLAPTIVSFDKRPNIYADQLFQRISKERIRRITGLEPLPHYAIFKWMWISNKSPEIYNKAWKLLCYGELVAVRLGFEPLIDYSMAARTLAFDLDSLNWSSEILSAAEIEVKKLPEIVAPGTSIGRLSDDISADLGLAPNATFVVGGLDQACAAVGAGLDVGGKSLLSMGTTGVLAEIFQGDQQHAGAIPVIPHVTRSERIAIAGTPAGGAVLRWFRDIINPTIDSETLSKISITYSDIIDSTENCSTDMIFVPHLGGSRIAFSDPDAKGAIVGLTFGTDRCELVRSILEGVAFEISIMKDVMRKDGFRIDELIAVGGGSKSKLWLQIMADILNVSIASTESADVAAFGAARIAAKAMDVGLDPRLLLIRDRFDPSAESSELYAGKRERFKAVYESLLIPN